MYWGTLDACGTLEIRRKAPHLPDTERASGWGCLEGEQENWEYVTSFPTCQHGRGVCDLRGRPDVLV